MSGNPEKIKIDKIKLAQGVVVRPAAMSVQPSSSQSSQKYLEQLESSHAKPFKKFEDPDHEDQPSAGNFS